MVVLVSAALAASATANTHRCASEARAHAEKLLRLHAELPPKQLIDLAPGVKVLPPIQNPMSAKQKFDVLELTGHVYKAQYRLRFIYAQIPDTCALMGQEILELARP